MTVTMQRGVTLAAGLNDREFARRAERGSISGPRELPLNERRAGLLGCPIEHLW